MSRAAAARVLVWCCIWHQVLHRQRAACIRIQGRVHESGAATGVLALQVATGAAPQHAGSTQEDSSRRTREVAATIVLALVLARMHEEQTVSNIRSQGRQRTNWRPGGRWRRPRSRWSCARSWSCMHKKQ